MAEPLVTCILGMHRCGTSLVARVLNILGVYLGPDAHLLMPAADNPRGFWEHEQLRRLNEEILAAFGGRWDEPPAFPPAWHHMPAMADIRNRARAIVEADFGGVGHWGWKDPRNSLTLPFWQDFLPPMRYVICLRSPLDVARSLRQRNSFSLEKGTALWLSYVASAIANTAGRPRVFVFLEDWMSDWRASASRLAAFLDLREAAERTEALEAADRFVDASLEHHRSLLREALEQGSASFSTHALYMALLGYVRAETSGSEMGGRADEPLGGTVDAFARLAVNADESLGSLRAQTAELAQRIAARDRKLSSLGEAAAGLRRELAEGKRVTETLEGRLLERERQLAGILQSRSWWLTRPLREANNFGRTQFRGVLRKRYRLQLKPLQGIRAIAGGVGRWESTGNDPQFALEAGGSPLPGGWVRVRASMEFDAELQPNPVLYVDDGAGFREEKAFPLGPPRGLGLQRILHLPGRVHRMRLDPTDHEGRFRVTSIEFQEMGGLEALALRLGWAVEERLRADGGWLPSLRKAYRLTRRSGVRELLRRLRQEGWRTPRSSEAVLPSPSSPWLDLATDEDAVRRDIAGLATTPVISILMPVHNTPGNYLRSAVASVETQLYGAWELCIVDDGSSRRETVEELRRAEGRDSRIRVSIADQRRGISKATNMAAALGHGDFIALLDHDDLLTPDALYCVVRLLNEDPEADVIYSDQDKVDGHGNLTEPFHKPDWSPEMLRAVMYVGHLLVVRRSLWEALGGLDPKFDGVQDFDLMLRAMEAGARVRHLPRIVYHWRKTPGSVAYGLDEKGGIDELQVGAVRAHLERTGVPAAAERHPRHRHRVVLRPTPRQAYPLISIVIPSRDAPELLGPCLRSVIQESSYPSREVVVVDNRTANTEALELLQRYPVTVVPLDEKFNYSRANNLGVQAARGEFVVLLNNDVEVLTPDWLEQLLFYLTLPDVGAVGPLLLYPDRSVQHAGVVLGSRGTADHVMRGFPAEVDGYAGSLSCPREVSAVTGACLMIRRSDYLALGGMVEDYASHYQDLDLCLRIRSTDRRILYVPHAALIHREGASRGESYDHFDRALLLDTWGEEIAKGDPFYNPNFSLGTLDYSLR